MLVTNTKKTEQINKKIPFYVAKFRGLIVLVAILLLLGFYFLLVSPQYHIYLDTLDQLEQTNAQVKNKLTSLAKNRQIIDNYQSIDKADKAKINQILPSSPELADLYVNLQSLVEQNSFKLENLVFSRLDNSQLVKNPLAKQTVSHNQSSLKKLEVNLSLSGVNYLKMKRFFSVLESNLRLCDVESFDFDPQSGELNVIFKTYYIN